MAAPSWLGEVARLYPGFYLAKLSRAPRPEPLPPGSAAAIVVPGMFATTKVYARLLARLRAGGTPGHTLDFGANMWGTVAGRVAKLRAAVDAHAATGGRIVLVGHSMGTLVCARYLLERPAAVVGFVSICGVFGGLKAWTMLGWPIFEVVREMRRGTGRAMPEGLRTFLRSPPVPTTIFQADRDEFVCDQSGVADVVRFPRCVTHNGPVCDAATMDAIAARVAEYELRSRS